MVNKCPHCGSVDGIWEQKVELVRTAMIVDGDQLIPADGVDDERSMTGLVVPAYYCSECQKEFNDG